MDNWISNGQYATDIITDRDKQNRILKGSGQSTDDVINLKQQGVGQKMTTGWHNHQGVSETPKSANVICEQPLILPLST